MSVLDVINNQNYYINYSDEAYSVVTTVSARHVVAYRDELGIAQNLSIGASSNAIFEAVDAISTHVRDSGLVKLHNAVEEYVRFYFDSNVDAAIVEAPGEKYISLISTDALKTADISEMTMCNDGDYQYMSTTGTKGFLVEGPGAQLQSLVAKQHVFGKDLIMFKRYDQASNMGDIAECGYSFRMNPDLQLELVKFSKVIVNSGYKTVLKKSAIFGSTAFAANSSSDPKVAGFEPFPDLDLLLKTSSMTKRTRKVPSAPLTVNSFIESGITFTYDLTNQYGNFGHTTWLYDGSNGSSLTHDTYDGAGTYTGVKVTGGVSGAYQALFGSSAFGFKGFEFTLINGCPKEIVILGSDDGVTFTNLATHTVASQTSTVSVNTFNFPKTYNKYYTVFTKTFGGNFVCVETRWWIYA